MINWHTTDETPFHLDPVTLAVVAGTTLATTAATGGFDSPDAPSIPAPPSRRSVAVQDAARRERNRRANARGRQSTILTGGLGATQTGQVRRTSLLGGGR